MANSELLIERGRGELVATALGTVVITGFVALAAANIVNGVALVASSVWLLLVGCVTLSAIRTSGLRGFGLSALGSLSHQQLLRITSDGVLETGFRLFNLSLIEFRIPVESLVALRCSAGQASDMAGRDVNDWSLFLYFRHGDPQKTAKQAKRHFPLPDQTVLAIGPAHARQAAESLAQRVTAFLCAAGVTVAAEGPAPRIPDDETGKRDFIHSE